jgi:hypothetical protein
MKQTYRWVHNGQVLMLFENGSVRIYDKAALEIALRSEQTAQPPPGTCSFKFYKRQQSNIAKFRAGLELLEE